MEGEGENDGSSGCKPGSKRARNTLTVCHGERTTTVEYDTIEELVSTVATAIRESAKLPTGCVLQLRSDQVPVSSRVKLDLKVVTKTWDGTRHSRDVPSRPVY